jgi:hypothetical protein
MQVVAEVHDIQGRLESTCSLLRRHGFRVTSELQRGGIVHGYRMVVPEALQLWYVYAVRSPPPAPVQRIPVPGLPPAEAKRRHPPQQGRDSNTGGRGGSEWKRACARKSEQ